MFEVILKKGRERSLLRRHPWVLSGAIADVRGDAVLGAWTCVRSAGGEVLGYGHYSPASSIRVRLLVFGPAESAASDESDESAASAEGDASDDEAVLAARIEAAVRRRERDPLLHDTDAVRLINAEGDGLPGLVADRYGDVVVARLSTAGMHARRDHIARALAAASGARWGYERADGQSARREGFPAREGPLFGGEPPDRVSICERGRRFHVEPASGQKTGFYLDQRDARDRVEALAAGRRVLDLFSYTGGFSAAAARGGAAALTLVDSSVGALALAQEHVADNLTAGGQDVPTRFERADVFEFVRSHDERYDLIVVDPPPFARRKGDLPRATRAYKDVVLGALRLAADDAFVLAFACSHHMTPELFQKVVFGAALDAGRQLQVLAPLAAPSDHPVSIDHPEGHYLSGLLLRVFGDSLPAQQRRGAR